MARPAQIYRKHSCRSLGYLKDRRGEQGMRKAMRFSSSKQPLDANIAASTRSNALASRAEGEHMT